MEAAKNNVTRKMTNQLLIRLTDCILENRFPDSKSDSMMMHDNYMYFPFNQEFSSKFGISEDLK